MVKNAREKEELRAVREALARTLPRPREDFRHDSWRAFQAALDRHLARRRARR